MLSDPWKYSLNKNLNLFCFSFDWALSNCCTKSKTRRQWNCPLGCYIQIPWDNGISFKIIEIELYYFGNSFVPLIIETQYLRDCIVNSAQSHRRVNGESKESYHLQNPHNHTGGTAGKWTMELSPGPLMWIWRSFSWLLIAQRLS